MTEFCLPKNNPIIAAGLASAGEFAPQLDSFLVGPPNDAVQPQGRVWMPIIPLVGSAALTVPPPARAQISSQSLDQIASMALARIKAIKSSLLAGAPWLVRMLAAAAFLWPASSLIKGKIRKALSGALPPTSQVGGPPTARRE